MRTVGIDRLTDSSLSAVALTAVCYLVFILLRLAHFDFNPTGFVAAGDQFCDPSMLPRGFLVLQDSAGYDGQFYYRLARDPFTSQESAIGVRLDSPPVRHQRMVYPLAVWALSLGKPEAVPWVMILVNYFGVCILAWVGAQYAQLLGRKALWGLVFPLCPGMVLTLARDLTEIVQAAFTLGGLLAYRKKRIWTAAVFLTLGVLTRETAILVPAGILLTLPLTMKQGETNASVWPAAVIPLVAYAVWQAGMMGHWGQVPLLAGGGNLGWPLAALGGFVWSCLKQLSLDSLIYLGEVLFLVGCAVGVACAFARSRAGLHIKGSWLLWGVLAVSLSAAVWVEDWSFLRVLADFYLLGAVILLGSKIRWQRAVFGAAFALWGFLALTRTWIQ